MPVFAIDKLKPKNNGAFALMDTMDIDHRGERLDSVLDAFETKVNQLVEDVEKKSDVVEIDVFDDVLCWRLGSEGWTPLFDFKNIGGNGEVNPNEVYVGPDMPTDPNIKVWIRTPSDNEEDDVETIEIPTKVSELENDMQYVSLKDIKDNLRIALSGDLLMLTYKGEMLNYINVNRIKEAMDK